MAVRDARGRFVKGSGGGSITDVVKPAYAQLMQGFDRAVTVGIHAAEGGEAHEGGMSVAELGSIHEFGLGVPERSFVRAWFDENKQAIPEAIRLEIETAIATGNVATVLDQLAGTLQASIQERISNGIEPENAEATILRKGSSTPLIDTGVLRSAVLAKVE